MKKVLTIWSKAREHLMQLMQDAGHKSRSEKSSTLVPGTAKHYGGAARMHASPRFGVTDGFNRLHDIPTSFVVDASCSRPAQRRIPTVGSTCESGAGADARAIR